MWGALGPTIGRAIVRLAQKRYILLLHAVSFASRGSVPHLWRPPPLVSTPHVFRHCAMGRVAVAHLRALAIENTNVIALLSSLGG